MKEALKPLDGQTHNFTGVVTRFSKAPRYGFKHSQYQPVLLLTEIHKGKDYLCQHSWVKTSPAWRHTKVGHKVRFRAKVMPYRKHGREMDYELTNIQDIKIIGEKTPIEIRSEDGVYGIEDAGSDRSSTDLGGGSEGGNGASGD